MSTKRTLIGNIKGPKGDTGAQGPQGATGPGATIEVGTVSTTAYGNTAQVTNSGTETAAVLDFVIPQGKPGEQTTKMSGLTLDTVTASTADYPIPATGDTGSVAWGKVIKFFNDAKTAIASKINISDIVNNLTSTATNKPLSAAQGKAINDALVTLNLVSATRVTGQATTGATGNIALGDLSNDGMTAVVAPLASGTSTFLRAWVSPTNNTWFLTAVNPNTGEVLSNQSISFRYWLLKFKRS